MLKMMKVAVLVLALAAATHGFTGQSRIVNGTNARPGEFPYIVSLQAYGGNSCGGSILDAKHILTAAHCVDGLSASAMSIKYGIVDLGTSGNTIDVDTVYKHENYSPSNDYVNDIAVLKLKSDIPLGQNAKPANLPKQGAAIPGNAPAVLAGWGYEKSGGSVQNTLQRVDLKVYTPEDCSRRHNGNVNSNYQLCAGVEAGGKGQCSGDSGGPLYSNGVQIGVVSWSVKPCGRKGFPGVFARVSSYINWINDKKNS